MRLSKLDGVDVEGMDGFQRVHPEPLQGRRKGTRTRRKKRLDKRASRKIQRKGGGGSRGEIEDPCAGLIGGALRHCKARTQSAKTFATGGAGGGSGNARTKRAKRIDKMQKIKGRSMGNIHQKSRESSWEPNIGFQRVYVDNDPRTMDGFGRVEYTNKELQGLSLDGFTILQGYAMGDSDDLEDWNYLLSIEHPSTMQGFPTWVLNGKKERKERQARRRAKREANKRKRQSARSYRGEQRSERRGRREEKKSKKQRRKEVKTATKEERLLRKQQRRDQRRLKKEDRRARQKQRLDDRKERKQSRQDARTERQRLRSEAKAGRKGFGESFGEFTGAALPFISDLVGGNGDFESFSFQDFTSDQIPFGVEDYIEDMRGQDDEFALSNRDLLEDEMEYRDIANAGEAAGTGAKQKSGGGMMVPLIIGAAVIASQAGKKKKKKRA